MQRRISAFNGYNIEAPDGNVGYISDGLFEDDSWRLRWFVINVGSWMMGRKILIHPSALGQPDVRQRAFSVTLSRAQAEASPELSSDPPVSLQMYRMPSDYYAYDQPWIGGIYGDDGLGPSAGARSMTSGRQNHEAPPVGDLHLRSVAEVTGYHIHALDGDIGHIEDFLVDDESWMLDYAIVDTKNWGFGKHVLVSPTELGEINWAQRYIRVELTRYKIKCGPSWKEPDWSDHPAG
jgi:hypothetical protein